MNPDPSPATRRRGSAPGERRGGRQKGTPNKATLEKRARAQAAIIADRDAPIEERELAKDALMRISQICEGAAAVNKPTLQSEIENGVTPNPDGNWDRYKGFLQLALFGYKAAADFQSPKMLAVGTAPPPLPKDITPEPRQLNIFTGGKYSETVTVGERRRGGAA